MVALWCVPVCLNAVGMHAWGWMHWNSRVLVELNTIYVVVNVARL